MDKGQMQQENYSIGRKGGEGDGMGEGEHQRCETLYTAHKISINQLYMLLYLFFVNII